MQKKSLNIKASIFFLVLNNMRFFNEISIKIFQLRIKNRYFQEGLLWFEKF